MNPLRRPVSIFLFAALGMSTVAGAATLEQIPSPRPTGWVTDLTGTLPLQTVAELNRVGDQVKDQTGVEMAVVVVGSIDGAPARAFATHLFKAWGIGEGGQGLLVFVSLGDQRTEIVLGDQIRDAARARAGEAVVREEMTPRFRQGDAAGAVLLGAAACARRLLGAHVTAALPVVDPDAGARLPALDDPLPSTALLPAPPADSPSSSVASLPGASGLLLGMGLLCGGLLAAWLISLKLLYSPPHHRRRRIMLDQAASDATGTW
ncbi:MAG: TPM domain-containing protein [Acidobacteria bacterium]|nr:TPM domain-containing protein [Acidobacteriota bacterium]